MESKEYEIAQTLVNFNQVNDHMCNIHQRRKDSTDALIDKNIYLFSEFQKHAPHPPSSSRQQSDCLVQLAPIRDNTHDQRTLSPIACQQDDDQDMSMEKPKSSSEKPRWSNPMRHTLLLAIIEQKELADMATFNWAAIGKQVGRSGKACKDQWRRAILPKLQQMYERDIDDE